MLLFARWAVLVAVALATGAAGCARNDAARFTPPAETATSAASANEPLSNSAGNFPGDFVPLGDVATVQTVEGPATIKGENGRLRSYVRLNVRDRSAAQFVAEARRAVAEQVRLPAGVHLEWTGQFEHQQRSFARLTVIVPLVIGAILLLLFWTYHDLADALLMMLAVPGAIAGGVLLQWLLGETLAWSLVISRQMRNTLFGVRRS